MRYGAMEIIAYDDDDDVLAHPLGLSLSSSISHHVYPLPLWYLGFVSVCVPQCVCLCQTPSTRFTTSFGGTEVPESDARSQTPSTGLRHPLKELRCQKAMLGVLVPGPSQSLRLFWASVRLCGSRDVKTPRPPPPPPPPPHLNSLCWQNDVPVS